MKRYSIILPAALSALFSCNKTASPDPYVSVEDGDAVFHDEIVLGSRLENPYSVVNVKSALESLYPTKAVGDIVATDKYVRFLPKDTAQFNALLAEGLHLIDHPVDYQIVREGDFYHDPGIPSESITWQYALVPYDFDFPEGIKYEEIEDCFLADNAPLTKSTGWIDWEAVEQESFRMTGNGDLLVQSTKGDRSNPEGRITVVDPDCNGGQRVGLSGVKVACNVFVKISTTYTDRDGYYKIPKSFTARPRYRLVFKNDLGFSIGFNAVLVPASVSTLGTGSPSGMDVTITSDSDRKLFRRSVLNNTAYDFYKRCSDSGLTSPASNLCFWMFDSSDRSSAIMLHHGTVMDKNSKSKIFGVLSLAVELFGPDITLGTKNCDDYRSIYSAAIHEMAHASHFSNVGVPYWNKYIGYIAKSFISGKDIYGDGTGENSGHCALGEMWAYYIQGKFYKERYGGADPAFGSDNWFHPQILTYLEDRGLTTPQIQKAFGNGEITDVDQLHSNLLLLYPQKQTVINQVFNRYEQ